MAGLKIFGTNPDDQPKPRQSFKDDIVGRFRSGHQISGRPASLSEWRVTTGDPDVAAKVHDLLGGDEPQKWATQKEDNLEVFTASKEVEIILEGPKALRQRMQLWSRSNKLVIDSDGETLADGAPDPDAELSFAERKKKYDDGVGPGPSITVYFRLADEPDLGIFMFQTGSWSLARELAGNDIAGQLEAIGGKATATLRLEEVEFVAKTGPQAGKTVRYTKSAIENVEPVRELAAAA